jgi:hypothetical protein
VVDTSGLPQQMEIAVHLSAAERARGYGRTTEPVVNRSCEDLDELEAVQVAGCGTLPAHSQYVHEPAYVWWPETLPSAVCTWDDTRL